MQRMGGGVAALALGVTWVCAHSSASPVHYSRVAMPLLLRAEKADDPDRRSLEVHAGAGQTLVPFLGDEDPRRNSLAGLVYLKREPHFRTRHKHGDLLQEIYWEHSHSRGASGAPPNTSEAIGYLFGARYEWLMMSRMCVYADLGLGLQYTNRRSVDLPSRLNSTPFIDAGLWLGKGPHQVRVGFRFLHISNAHQVGSNQGQNQLFLDVGMRL